MKRLVSIFTVLVLVSVFALNCAAKDVSFESDGIALSIQESFAVFTKDNLDQMSSDLADLELTKAQVSGDMEKGHFLMMAVSKEYGCTVTLSKTQNEFSKTVGDLYRITDSKTAENAKTILLGKTGDKVSEIKEIEQNGALFYRLVYEAQPLNSDNSNPVSSAASDASQTTSSNTMESTSSEYSVMFNTANTSAAIVYATIMNDSIYTLCLLDSSGTLTERSNDVIDWIFKSLKYTVDYSDADVKYNTNRLLTILLWISIPVGVLLAGLLTVSIIRDYRKKHAEENLEAITPKKPRR